MKGLNKSGNGKNRFKFHKRAERVSQVNVDVVHQTKLPDTLDTSHVVPETGTRGCHFQDQLESCKNLDSSGEFCRFYYDVWPLVQSMPELLHHLPKVVSKLQTAVLSAPAASLPSFLSLISVLARDIQEDLFKHFDDLFGAVSSLTSRIINAGSVKPSALTLDPELTGKIFECISHMLRFLWKPIAKNTNSIRHYYGSLLGHSTAFVREFSAKSFPIVLRRVSQKQMMSHWKKTYSAVVSNFVRYHESNQQELSCLKVNPLESDNSEEASGQGVPKRLRDLLDGIVLLVFYICKGVKGCLHSFAGTMLPVLFETFGSIPFTFVENFINSIENTSTAAMETSEKVSKKRKVAIKASSNSDANTTIKELSENLDENPIASSWISGFIVSHVIVKLFRHVHPDEMAGLWLYIYSLLERSVAFMKMSKRIEICDALMETNNQFKSSAEIMILNTVEIMIFLLTHSTGRALSQMTSKEEKQLMQKIVTSAFDLCDCILDKTVDLGFSVQMYNRCTVLICDLWKAFPRDPRTLRRIDLSIQQMTYNVPAIQLKCHIAILSNNLLNTLPNDLIQQHLIEPLIKALFLIHNCEGQECCSREDWLTVFLRVLYAVHDVRSGVIAAPCEEEPGDEDALKDSDMESAYEEQPRGKLLEGASRSRVLSTGEPRCIYIFDEDLVFSNFSGECSAVLEKLIESCIKISIDCLDTGVESVIDSLYLALSCLNWFAVCRRECFEKPSLKNKVVQLFEKLSVVSAILQSKGPENAPKLLFSFSLLLRISCQFQYSCKVFRNEKQLLDSILVAFAIIQSNPSNVMMLWSLLGVIDYLFLKSEEQKPGEKYHLLSSHLPAQTRNALVTALSPTIITGSYWLRISALRIICHLTASLKTITTDNGEGSSQRGDIEVCSLCLEAACMPPSLSSEREYVRRVGNLESWIRLGLISKQQIIVVCSFCLGMFDYKFKPFWEPAVATLIAAIDHSAVGEQDLVWELILDVLVKKSYAQPPVEYSSALSDVANAAQLGFQISRSFASLLLDANDGVIQVSVSTYSDVSFPYALDTSAWRHKTHTSDLKVELDARTDYNTSYITLWSVFRRCPKLTMQRSKTVVPIFLSFVRLQYYSHFDEEVEIPDLIRSGVLSTHKTLEATGVAQETSTSGLALPILPPTILKKRLEMFLQVFAAIISPKQLYQHQLLYSFYHILLAKSDLAVAKLALDCILTYKSDVYSPFVTVFKDLMDDKKIRTQLVTFDPSVDSHTIALVSRPEVVLTLVRILYGKFSAKISGGRAARDNLLSCRVAILTFLNLLDSAEIVYFLYYVFRSVLPKSIVLRAAKKDHLEAKNSADYKWYTKLINLVKEVDLSDMDEVVNERKIGFLNLLQQFVKIMGHSLSGYLNQVGELIVLILTAAESSRRQLRSSEQSDADVVAEKDDEDELLVAEENANLDTGFREKKALIDALKIRRLSLLRLSELVHQYHNVSKFSFLNARGSLWAALKPIIDIVPNSLIPGAKPPALLKFVHALCKYPDTIAHVANDVTVVTTLVLCAGRKCDIENANTVIESLSGLLDFEHGRVLMPHAELLIESFARKFAGPDVNVSTDLLKLSQLTVYSSGNIQLELTFLCRLSEELFTSSAVNMNSLLVSNFATLLLAMIRTYSMSKKIRVEEEWLVNVLRVYRALIPRMNDVSHHVNFVSRCFGPTANSFSLFNSHTVRNFLCEILSDMSAHPSTRGVLESCSSAMANLIAMDKTIMGVRDFSLCMPVFQALCSDDLKSSTPRLSWSSIMGPENCENPRDATMCVSVMYEMVRCMYDEEQALRSSALAGLKKLIETGFTWAYGSSTAGNTSESWLDNLRGGLIPAIHAGLHHSTDAVTKGFIALVCHSVKFINNMLDRGIVVNDADLHTFHADLSFLLHVDPEQDFFENISHIQLHRRIKAMGKLNMALSTSEFSIVDNSSLMNVFIPIALHPLQSSEFLKKDHLQLLQEAALLLGTLSGRLPWSHYYNVTRRVLKLLDRIDTDKEKVLLNALCHVLDKFPFDLSQDMDKTESDIDIQADEAENVDEAMMEDTVALPQAEDQVHDLPDTVGTKGKMVRIIISSLMPWVKRYLFKEETNSKGIKTKVVRTQIAVALTKLIHRLQAPAVTKEKKDALFTNLAINVANTLKSHDVTARDQARESLSKMVFTMGMDYLYPVLYELKHALKEGYQRHVLNYTVRYVLSEVLSEYSPMTDAPSMIFLGKSGIESKPIDSVELLIPSLDKCVPMIMECVLDDLVGKTQDDLKAEGASRAIIREAKGNKASDILEVLAKNVLFRPSYALLCPDNPSSVSSVHGIVIPLINCLTAPDDDETLEANFVRKSFAVEQDDVKSRIGRVSEALRSVAFGFAKNLSVLPKELLLYLHATLQPFIISIIRDVREQKRMRGKLLKQSDPDSSLVDDFESEISSRLPSYFLEDLSDDEDFGVISSVTVQKKTAASNSTVSSYRPSIWLPFEKNHAKTQLKAVTDRNADHKYIVTVSDGVNAPKRTGYGGRKKLDGRKKNSSTTSSTDASVLAAVKFCLTLLSSSIKHDILDGKNNEEVKHLAAPFLPILGQCLCLPGSSAVGTLALRCLCSMLGWGLEVQAGFSRLIATKILRSIVSGGALVSADSEMVQGYMKGLTSLFSLYNEHKKLKKVEKVDMQQNALDEEGITDINKSSIMIAELPLSIEDIRSLASMLTVAVLESSGSHQSATFQLIRVFIETRVVVPEIYDLIAKLMDQIVLSHRKSVREACSSAVISFMLNFPVGNKRLLVHIKQLIKNCSFEYETGRSSALSVLQTIVKIFPLPVLQDIATMIFFPMVQASVSDESPRCRESAADVILSLSQRVSTDTFSSFQEYSFQWMSSGIRQIEDAVVEELMDSEKRMLVKTGCLVSGILVSGRPDLCKKSNRIQDMAVVIFKYLQLLLRVNGKSVGDNNAQVISLDEREGSGDGGGSSEWSVLYHVLLLVEKMYSKVPSVTDAAVKAVFKSGEGASGNAFPDLLFMDLIQESLVYPHAWIRLVSCRVLNEYCSRRDWKRGKQGLISGSGGREFLVEAGGLYGLGRRLCVVLNMPKISDELLLSGCGCLVFVVNALVSTAGDIDNTVRRRHLKGSSQRDTQRKKLKLDSEAEDRLLESDKSESDEEQHDGDEEGSDDGDVNVKNDSSSLDEDLVNPAELEDGADSAPLSVSGHHWIMQRLRGIGIDSRGNRRLHVLNFFSLLLKSGAQEDFLLAYAKVIVEVCIRARLRHEGVVDTSDEKSARYIASEILEYLESKIGSNAFIGLYGEIQRVIQLKKNEKKRSRAADAVRDPRAYAERKVAMAQRKKQALKRKNTKHAVSKGKRRRMNE